MEVGRVRAVQELAARVADTIERHLRNLGGGRSALDGRDDGHDDWGGEVGHASNVELVVVGGNGRVGDTEINGWES